MSRTMFRDEAIKEGFIIDNHANIAYKGPRFNPDEWFAVYSEREELLIKALQRMLTMHDKMFKQTNVGASFYGGDTLQEMNEAPIQARRALHEVGVQS